MIEEINNGILERRRAIFSECMKYRFLLDIVWNESLPLFVGIGLNPSTATHLKMDNTMTKMCGFALREGCGGVRMLNAFAYRATEPKDMLAADDPIGKDNDLVKLMDGCAGPRVACWGRDGKMWDRGDVIRRKIPNLLCFGRNKDGSPKHPLYLRADTKLEPFSYGGAL